MNWGCLVWMGEKCGGEDMIIVFKYIKSSCRERHGQCVCIVHGGEVKKERRPRLEMRRSFPAVKATKHGNN